MSRLSVDSRELLDAARDGDEPTAADRARVRSALARKIAMGAAAGVAVATATHAATGATAATAAGAGTAAAGTTTATTSIGVAALGAGAGGSSLAAGGMAATFAGSLGAKLLVSVAIVSAVGAGTVTYSRHEAAKHVAPSGPSVAAVAPTMAKSSPMGARGLAAGGATADEASIPNATPNATPTPTPTTTPNANATATPTPTPNANATATPTPTSPLDAELAFLQDAHSALRANDGARALRILAEHGRRFPNGQLREESEAARVFALCELGRVDEARDVAGRFLREHPQSPLAPRVARACDDGSSTF